MSAAQERGEEGWRLDLLGPPRLTGPGVTLGLEGKTAAMLARVGCSGGASKALLATWLWPDSPYPAARANLRQMMRRLRAQLGRELVVGAEVLTLAADVEVDVRTVRALAAGERYAEALAGRGELLAGLSTDGMPDVEEWLTTERETLQRLYCQAARHEALQRERAGDLTGALESARLGVQLEPLSEDAWRLLMRLHYQHGDRGAALAAFERCAALLRAELNVDPLPETKALAAEIGRGARDAGRVASTRPPLPLAVVHPPVLVGRENLWARMEAAWQDHRMIFLVGESGAGKTRLATEFLATKGPYLRLDARPGDAGIPYATAARAVRQLLARLDEAGGAGAVPAWATLELARLVPALGEHPPPLASDDDKLRLYEAVLEVHRGLGVESTILLDDAQFSDAATSEMAIYLFGQSQTRPSLRAVDVMRSDRLDGPAGQAMRRLVEAGAAVLLEVPPLDEHAIEAWLAHLPLPTAGEGFAARLHRYTGGNALFVAETLRHLHETGRLGEGLPRRLPPPGRVAEVLERRLKRLSRAARHVARAAAVLQSDFSPESVAAVLGSPLLDVLDAWEELEGAQVMQGHRFHHDLMQEAVDADIPETVRRALHRSAARALSTADGHPARIARHWIAGGDPGRAAPLFVRAAQGAGDLLQFLEARDLYASAADAYDAAGDAHGAFEARAAVFERLWLHDLAHALGPLARRLMTDARTPQQRARACLAQAITLVVGQGEGDASEIEPVVLEGLEALSPLRPPPVELRTELLRVLIEAAVKQGGPERVEAAIARAEESLGPADASKGEAMLRLSVGAAWLRLWRLGRSFPPLARAVRELEDLGDAYGTNYARTLLALSLELSGRYTRAEELRREVARHSQTTGALHYFNTVHLGANLVGQHRYSDALGALERGQGYRRQTGFPSGMVDRVASDLYWALGDWEACEAAVDRALADPEPRDLFGIAAWVRKGQVCARRGRSAEAEDIFAKADELAHHRGLPVWQVQVNLARAACASAAEAGPLIGEALRLAREHDLAPLLAAALSAEAERLLDRGDLEAALEVSTEAISHWHDVPPRDDVLRPWLVHHRILSALGRPGAALPLDTARRWLDGRIERHVPPAHLRDFLDRPTHRAVWTLTNTPNSA